MPSRKSSSRAQFGPEMKILLMGSFIWYFGEGMLGPLYAIFAQHIGGDILDITGAWAVYLITTGVISILIGRRMKNKLDMKYWMIIGYGLNAAATFGYILVDSPLSLLIVQLVLGVASALATPTWDALYSIYESRKKAGTQWGIADGGPHIVTGIAVLFGGFVIALTGFTTLFIIMGLIQILAVAVQTKIILK